MLLSYLRWLELYPHINPQSRATKKEIFSLFFLRFIFSFQ